MRRTRPTPDQAPESALARLLEVESRLEAMLAEVRAETAARVAAAHGRAVERADRLVGELAAAEAELAGTLEAEAEARIAEEHAGREAVRQRYESLDEAGIEALSGWIVDAILRTAAGEEE